MAEVINPAAGECPALESIAAYLDGRLPDSERVRLTEHLAVCEDCYIVFSESVQTRVPDIASSQPAAPVRGWLARPRVIWVWAGGALAAAACVWLAVNVGDMTSSWRSNRELQALVAAVGTDRPIEARLTGGFAHGPLRGGLRSGEQSSTITPDVRIAAARLEKTVLGRRSPQAHAMLGLAYLTTGDIDRAVLALEEAADRPSPDARALSDLSAAYVARGTRLGQTQDYAKALAVADRAVKASPGLVEAWFNRACALERLSLVEEARIGWEEYLRLDDQSGWADEARQHLRGLR